VLPRERPAGAISFFEKNYAFGWLGVLGNDAAGADELIYVNPRARLRALQSRAAARAALLPAGPLSEQVDEWPDERSGPSCAAACAPTLPTGSSPALDRKSIAPAAQLRRRGPALRPPFLAGDAGHSSRPRTGAKGLNLAASDVHTSPNALSFYIWKFLGTWKNIFLARAGRV